MDTNVLVYAVDTTAGNKGRVAAFIVEHLSADRRAVVSSQVIAEFYSVVTRPKSGKAPLYAPAHAATLAAGWIDQCAFVGITESMVRQAMIAAYQHEMNIYDAQVWAAAMATATPTILTEDIPGSAPRLGLRYVNPFAVDFDLADVGL